MQMPEPDPNFVERKKTLSWQDGCLCVLVHLRSGADTCDLFPQFGVSEPTLRRHFLVYLQVHSLLLPSILLLYDVLFVLSGDALLFDDRATVSNH